MLQQGKTVAFPTETVYGLGADALDAGAVERIFAAKQRPAWDPLIVHIWSMNQLSEIAEVPAEARKLMDAFWPGPLTLLLTRTAAVPDAVTAGRPLVGVRMPKHPVALELLRQAGLPVAAPSANTFSHTSPTCARHVLDDLDGRIDAVLDGGETEVGLESTVAEVRRNRNQHGADIIVYRPGAIDLEMLDQVVGGGRARLYIPDTALPLIAPLPAPGVGLRHYAPRARLLLIDQDFARAREPLALSLVRAIDDAQKATGRAAVMLPENWNAGSAHAVFAWGPWEEPEILARRLFAGLRALDEQGADIIVCPLPQIRHGLGDALRDRLRKAAKSP